MLALQQTHDNFLTMGRDAFLTKRDILNQRKQLDDPWYQIHEDDSISIQYWVEKNEVDVFLLNQEPFTLGIMMRWQVEQVVRHGHNNVLMMDSTFCTNKYKVFWFLFTLFTMSTLFSMVRIHENIVYRRLVY
jgi:hypothetical protein